MSYDLFEFSSPVKNSGYEWITTRYDRQPEAPTPLPEGATRREKAEHESQRRKAEPRQYLWTGSVNLKPEDYRWMEPLKEFPGLLHRRFAETETTTEGIKAFADNFGLLRADVPVTILLDHRLYGRDCWDGESLEAWTHEITALHDALEVWDLVRLRNEDALRDYVDWREDMVVVLCSRHAHFISKDLDPLYEDLKRGELLEPATLAVQKFINAHLWQKGRAAPKLFWNPNTRALEQHVSPNGLIGAIWLDFLLAVDGKTEYSGCGFCGAWFPQPIKGPHKRFCSNSCRTANHRKARKEKEG